MDLCETGCEDVNWNKLAQDLEQYCVLKLEALNSQFLLLAFLL